MDFAGRRQRLRGQLQRPLLVTSLPNLRYLTGFTGSNAALIIDPSGHDALATDGRYRDQIVDEVPELAALITRDTAYALAVRHGGSLEVESELGFGMLRRLVDAGLEIALAETTVESLRTVKDADEQALLEQANSITGQAIAQVWTEIRPGMTERALARRLEQLFGELGAEDRAFPSIVAVGDHTAIPHHAPTDRQARTGDLVLIDAGARVGGYHADMTRVAVLGVEPSDWQRTLHAVVAEAAQAGRDRLRAGAAAREVDAAARTVIAEAGFAEQFTHGLGHGTGLEIHEAPMIGPSAAGTIPEFASVTVEPGVYLPGRGGIRIEDTLLVGRDSGRVITPGPRDLVVAG